MRALSLSLPTPAYSPPKKSTLTEAFAELFRLTFFPCCVVASGLEPGFLVFALVFIANFSGSHCFVVRVSDRVSYI